MDGTGSDVLASCACGEWTFARYDAQRYGAVHQHDEFDLRRIVRRRAGAHAGNCGDEVTIHV